jgi:hypothetical protein
MAYLILVGLVIGALQLGMRIPFGFRLGLVLLAVLGEACMIPTSVHGFPTLMIVNWCYVIGVPLGLLGRSWNRTEERFLSYRHLDWVALALATVIMQSIYVHPMA